MSSPQPIEKASLSPSPDLDVLKRVRRATFGALLIVVFCGGIAVDRLVLQSGEAGASSSLPDLPEFQTLVQTWDKIRTHYVESSSIDDQTLIYGAARGMVEALGDSGHSTFLDPREAKIYEDATNGEFVGIGVQIDYTTGVPVIVSALDGSPSQDAGLRTRDIIVEISGEKTDGMSQQRASDLLRGDEGTKVELSVLRPSTGETLVFTLTRRNIKIIPVSWAMLPDHVGLIRVSEFSNGAIDGVKNALKAIKEQGGTSIILDLRDNPGGFVHEAIGVASQFMAEGKPIYLYQEKDKDPRPVNTTGEGLGTDIPLAVLVNQGSASAAEIVASGFKDNNRAKLYGERTFGTGTVLTSFPLDDGSEVVLGIGLWLTPNGEQIWHKGVEPNVKVDLSPEADPLRPSNTSTVNATDFEKSLDSQLHDAFDALAGTVASSEGS